MVNVQLWRRSKVAIVISAVLVVVLAAGQSYGDTGGLLPADTGEDDVDLISTEPDDIGTLQHHPFEAQHYNVCASHRAACRVAERNLAWGLVNWFLRNDGTVGGVWSVSINEVCLGQLREMNLPNGYDFSFYHAKENADGCPDGSGQNSRFGNAVISYGFIIDSARWIWREGGECDRSQGDECRGFVCRKVINPGGEMGTCSVHTDGNTFQAVNYEQITSDWMTPYSNYLLAGDFNRDAPSMPPIYEGYVGLSRGHTWHTRTGLRNQFDYIWASRVGGLRRVSPYCPKNASDHCYVSAELYWPGS